MLKTALFLSFLFSTIQAIPPRQIPPKLYDEFTLHRQIPVIYSYINETYPPNRPRIYSYGEIEALKQKALAGEENYYSQTDRWLYQALSQHTIRGKKVAVIGSVVPWYEAVVLAYGGSPVTIEYNAIRSEHPAVQTMTVSDFAANPQTFDAIFSISSYEHDGLGRYGDPINPRGDLDSMEKAKQMLNPGGLLFLAVPIGKDQLVWNAHRIYGAIRLPLLLAGWEILETFGFADADLERKEFEQPIFVLRRKETP